MFAIESEMTKSVARWMEVGGLDVREEFVTPWGICDLVGVSFVQRKVANRLKLQQTAAICSITRALLLREIPDVKTGKSTTLDKLVRRYAASIPAEVVSDETERLIAGRFVKPAPRGRLQKVNGWIPLQKRLVAVELKLARIEEVMRQALNNMGFASESYVGLPSDVARRVALKPSRWSRFFASGVGLLSVARGSCEVLVKSRTNKEWTDSVVQFHCVEKFWRTRVKGN